MKAEDLKTKTEDELKKMLLDTRKEQFNLRFQRSNGTLEKTSEMRKVRRTIARIKTFLNTTQVEGPAPKGGKKTTKKTTEKKAAVKKPAAKKKTTKKTAKKAA
ncbi:MAG: 50S ribosomal protein L29 [Pseudomonadota bacterium]